MLPIQYSHRVAPVHCTTQYNDGHRLLVESWQRWAGAIEVGANEQRYEAVARLKQIIADNHDVLDLSHLNLTGLPIHLPFWIRRLDVSCNQLSQLPVHLPYWLKRLDASFNELIYLPEKLPPYLQELYLLSNQLRSLPPQLPTVLRKLDVGYNQLIALPDDLPAHLMALQLIGNQLTSLPSALPLSLNELDVSTNSLSLLPEQLPPALCQLRAANNQLSALPAWLPDSLQLLDVHNNQLTRLPTPLPAHLLTLYVMNNQLTALPDSLPSSLQLIDASGNQLKQLPAPLPRLLTALCVGENQLTCLPLSLPVTIKKLDVSFNQLHQLPDYLPACLTELAVNHNQLTTLPLILPPLLDKLNVSHNQLSQWPDYLPASLTRLSIQHNSIDALPAWLPYRISEVTLDHALAADWRDLLSELPLSPQATFTDKIAQWTSNTVPWRGVKRERHARQFAHFLQKLKQGRHGYRRELKTRVAQLLDYLVKAENSTLRTELFSLAEKANRKGTDRCSFYFNQMYVAMMDHQLIHRQPSVAELLKVNQGLFRLQLLEKLAADDVATKQQTVSPFAKEIETYFAYQYQLRQPLSLPIETEWHHAGMIVMTEQEIAQVVTMVLQQEKRDFIRYLVTQSRSWRAALVQWDQAKVGESDDAYLTALTSDTFKRRVDKILRQQTRAIDDQSARRVVEQQQADHCLYQHRYQLSQLFWATHHLFDVIDYFDHP